MLKQLTSFRVHLIFAAAISAWFLLGTIAGVADGDGVLHAFWASVREIKVMEWVGTVCLWVAIATLTKEVDTLRAKLKVQANRQ